jgi:hypothetical protein
MAVVYAPAFTLRCIRGAYSANTALRAQQSVTTLHGNAELALKVPSTSPSVNFFSVLAMRLPRVFPLFTSVRSTPLPRTRLVARLARWSTIPMPVPTGARPEQGKGFFTPAPDAYFGLHRVTFRVSLIRAPPPGPCMALGWCAAELAGFSATDDSPDQRAMTSNPSRTSTADPSTRAPVRMLVRYCLAGGLPTCVLVD